MYYVMAENGIGGRAFEWAQHFLGYSTAWYSSGTVSRTNHVDASRQVNAVLAVLGDDHGKMVFQKVRLTYQASVLQ